MGSHLVAGRHLSGRTPAPARGPAIAALVIAALGALSDRGRETLAAAGANPPGTPASPGGSAVETASAGRYQVGVHLEAPGLAGRMARLLASFEASYLRMWMGRVALRPAPDRVEVRLLGDPAELRRALASLGESPPSFEPGGAYVRGRGLLLLAVTSRLERGVAAALIHEAAHMLNDSVLEGAGPLTPWLNEGLAQYCQYSEITPEGEVTLGRIDPGSALRVQEGEQEYLHQFIPRKGLDYLLGQFRRDPRLSLGPLLDIAEPRSFYGQRAQLHYAQSWTLVHLLAEAKAWGRGPLRPYLERYVRLEQESGGGRRALLDLLAMPIEDLDSAWYRHVRKMR